MKREEMMAMAQAAADSFPGHLRVVVVVTDDEGEFCGVGSNTTPEDCENCLKAALVARDRQWGDGSR